MDIRLNEIKCVFFIGIGGIGMSAIARYLKHIGKEVYGYDKTETTLTKKLVSEGIEVIYEEDIRQVRQEVDLVIYTPAIPDDSILKQHCQSMGVPMIKRARALGLIGQGQRTIAIAGTHGKTSTTALTSVLLKYGGLDISAFIGGIVKDFKSNLVLGEEETVVVEADEYDRSFLQLDPTIASVMSMDSDHLDIYGSEDQLHQGFNGFISKIVPQGKLLIKQDLMPYISVDTLHYLKENSIEIITCFGEDSDVAIDNIRVQDGRFYFDYHFHDVSIYDANFGMAGRHNIENASVGLTIALLLGLDPADLKDVLRGFKGIARRFDRITEGGTIDYIDDYAHHPTELRATIKAVKELYPAKRVTGVFQPHLYSRTRDYLDNFAEVLDQLDECILLDIYPARELPIEGISSAEIAKRMKKNAILSSKEDVMEVLKNIDIEILLTLGAGDIDTLVPKIKEWIVNDK